MEYLEQRNASLENHVASLQRNLDGSQTEGNLDSVPDRNGFGQDAEAQAAA